MLSSISSILTSSLEAGLLFLIILLGLNKTGLYKYKKLLSISTIVSLLMSIFTVYIADFFGDREIFEGYLSFAASIGALIFWVWILINFKKKKENAISHGKNQSIINGLFILIISFLLLFGKSIEIVMAPNAIFLMSNLVNTETILKIVGLVLGLIITALFAFIFLKAQNQITKRMYLIFTTLVLLVVILRQVIMGLQVLFAIGALPLTTWAVSIIAPLINNYYPAFFYLLIVFTTILWISIRNHLRKNPPDTSVTSNPAQKRKLLANFNRERKWVYAKGYLLVLILAALIGNSFLSNREIKIEPPEHVDAHDGEIEIGLEELSDGNLHRYAYTTEQGIETRFIAIKKSSSLYGIALDACGICGAAGYYQDGKKVICKSCGVEMNVATIGLPGGCNPIPLKNVVNTQGIVINTSGLVEKQDVFNN